MDVSLEAWWLAERSSASGYVVVVLTLFGVRGSTQSYDFTCPPKTRVSLTLLVTVHYIVYVGLGKKGKLVQIMKNCNEYRG